MDRDDDVLAKYRSISNKLKKRFLKKPNVAEGSEQFKSLAKSLQQQDCPQYAGFCSLAQARCEHTLGNSAGEGHALIEAARAFLQAEHDTADLHCPTFKEHLNAAINCYSHAIRVYMEGKHLALAAALCLELGNALQSFGKPGQAIQHYQRAAELQSQDPLACLKSLSLIASCKLKIRDYEGTLGVLTEVTYLALERGGGSDGRPLRAFADILAQAEVTRVLLLMLLQPTPQRIRPEHGRTLEKYSWAATEEDPVVGCMPSELYLQLQSVVMACQSKDIHSLRSLQNDLRTLLTTEQNELLYRVVQEMLHPSGEGY